MRAAHNAKKTKKTSQPTVSRPIPTQIAMLTRMHKHFNPLDVDRDCFALSLLAWPAPSLPSAFSR